MANIVLNKFKGPVEQVVTGQVTRTRPSPGYADLTQSMMNGLPSWHIGRRQRDSLPSILANCLVGRHLQPLLGFEMDNFSSQMHASVANSIIHDKAFTIDLINTNVQQNRVYNKLQNSNFQEWSNPYRLPDYWSMSSEDFEDELILIQVSKMTNYIGGYALSLLSNREDYLAYGEVKVFQIYNVPSTTEDRDWSSFCFFKRTGSTPMEANFFEFYMKLTLEDGVIVESYKGLSETMDWQKCRIEMTGSKKVSSIEVGIRWNPLLTTEIFNIHADNFMLHPSHENVFWAVHPLDSTIGVATNQTGYCVISSDVDTNRRTRAIKISDNEFTRRLLPTDVEFIDSIPASQIVISDTTTRPVLLPDGYTFDGNSVSQGLIVVTERIRSQFGWPLWTIGRLVKYDLNDNADILGSYIPSFPIVNNVVEDFGFVEAISSIVFNAVIERDGYLWIIGKIAQGDSLRNTKFFRSVLLIVDNLIPKQENDFSETGVDYENNPIYIPIVKTLFISNGLGNGYGDFPYGDEPYGGEGDVLNQEIVNVDFVSSTEILLVTVGGDETTLDLHYNYFIENPLDRSLVLFRNNKLNHEARTVVVC